MRTSFPHAPSSSDTTPAQSEQLPTAHVPMRGNNNGDGINRSGGGEPPDNSPDIDDPSLPPHWHVAIAASLIHALHATAIYMGPATLLSPMRLSLDLSVEQITRPLIAFRSIQAIFLLPAGYVLDLFGPQRCLRFAMTAAAILAPFLPLVTSLSQLVVLQALCGLTKAFGGLSAMILLTNLRFAHRRGLATATGFVLSGYSLAGFFAPAVIGVVAQSYGWRFALGALSLGFAVTALPLTFYYCREPQHRYRGVTLRSLWTTMRKKGGLKGGNASAVAHDGGGEGVVSSPSSVASSEDLRRRLGKRFGDSAGGEPSAAPLNHADLNHANEPLIQPAYVTVMVAVSAFSFAMHIVLDHLLVFLREDFGMPFETATLYISALNLVALFAKLAVGPLAERFNMSLLMAAFALLGVFSSTLLLDVSMAGIAVTASVTKVIAFVGLCKLFALSMRAGFWYCAALVCVGLCCACIFTDLSYMSLCVCVCALRL